MYCIRMEMVVLGVGIAEPLELIFQLGRSHNSTHPVTFVAKRAPLGRASIPFRKMFSTGHIPM